METARRRPSSGLVGQDVDQLAAAAATELHPAGGRGEQRVIATPPDVVAGVERGAALADDDRPGRNEGAVVGLHAEALGLGVTPVPGGATTLGLRHVRSALRDA